MRAVFSNYASTLAEVGTAMIKVVLHGSKKKVLEVRDINELAGRSNVVIC
jgi:hypothetical protein